MAMLKTIDRLFTLKTRTEAWLVIYAIAVGAVERAQHYLEMYPGNGGYMLALACTGVVFVAGAKLLDATRPAPAAMKMGPYPAKVSRRLTRNRPRARPSRSGSELPLSLRRD